MKYQPEHLKRWTRPSDFGQHVDDWFYTSKAFVFLGRHRDSDALTESNFECALAALGGESDTVQVIREGHWAVGWVEWIAIHESDSEALECADEIQAALSDYPVLDESDLSDREWSMAQDTWDNCWSLRDKVEACKEAGLSIFAARSESIPQGDGGYIFERCLCH